MKETNNHQGRKEYDCRNRSSPTQKICGTGGTKQTTRCTTTESRTHIRTLAMLHQDKNDDCQRRNQHGNEC